MNLADQLAQDSKATAVDDSAAVANQILDSAKEVQRLEALCTELEGEIKTAKKIIKDIVEDRLPDCLDDIGTETWANRSEGVSVQMSEEFYGNFPKDEQRINRAVDYIKSVGCDEILTVELVVNYKRSQFKLALDSARLLEERSSDSPIPIVRYKVHPATLKKFCKLQSESNPNFDSRIVGMFKARRAKVKG